MTFELINSHSSKCAPRKGTYYSYLASKVDAFQVVSIPEQPIPELLGEDNVGDETTNDHVRAEADDEDDDGPR